MKRSHRLIVFLVWLSLAGTAGPAGLPVGTATGVVKKATANVLLVAPRRPDGRFEKTLALKVSGTSKVTTLTAQTRGGQTVFVQKEISHRDLQANQPVAVIYATINDEAVLLTAVVQPAPGK